MVVGLLDDLIHALYQQENDNQEYNEDNKCTCFFWFAIVEIHARGI